MLTKQVDAARIHNAILSSDVSALKDELASGSVNCRYDDVYTALLISALNCPTEVLPSDVNITAPNNNY